MLSDQLFEVGDDAVEQSSDDCYTPSWVFAAMGLRFGLDVAAPPGGPRHVPADRWFTASDDGRTKAWDGLVWCNPPFSGFSPWADRWAAHPSGVLLGCYQPETRWTRTVFRAADVVAFVSIKFERPDGTLIKPRMGTFVAFRGLGDVGDRAARALAAADKYGGTALHSRGASAA